MPWINKSGEYGNFCGAISLAGKIIYELPIKQHLPDRLFEFGASQGEKNMEIDIGSRNYPEEDSGETNVHDFREALMWTYPNKLKTVKLKK